MLCHQSLAAGTNAAATVVFLIVPSSRAEKYPEGRSCMGITYRGDVIAAAASGDSGRRFSERFATRMMGVADRQIAWSSFISIEYHYICRLPRGISPRTFAPQSAESLQFCLIRACLDRRKPTQPAEVTQSIEGFELEWRSEESTLAQHS